MASSIDASVSGAGGVITTADNTGILQLKTAGTTAVTVDASQNVGIGTTSTYGKLTILGNGTGSYNTLTLTNGTTNSTTKNGIITGSPYTNTNSSWTAFGLEDTGSVRNVFVGGGGWGVPDATRLSFYTAPSYDQTNNAGVERMRIFSSGNIGMGVTTDGSLPSSGIWAAPSYDATNASGIAIGHANGSASGTTYVGFVYNSSKIGSITQNGTTAIAYNTSSDYRLKENIAPMTGALDKVTQLKPVTYTWKLDGSDGQGFIAHELAEVVPDCVTGEKDAVETYTDEDGNEQTRPKYQGIDTSFLVATLTAAIQEQQTIINDLKARVTALEGASL